MIREALDRAVERIVGDRGEQRQAELRQAIDRVKAEIGRLVGAVAEGGDSQALTAEIHKREARQRELQYELEGLLVREFVDWRSDPSVRQDLEQRIQDWRGLLRLRAPQGRQILRKLIEGRLVLTPHREGVAPYYTFTGSGTLTSLLSGVLPHKVASPSGVLPFTMRGAVTPTAA